MKMANLSAIFSFFLLFIINLISMENKYMYQLNTYGMPQLSFNDIEHTFYSTIYRQSASHNLNKKMKSPFDE